MQTREELPPVGGVILLVGLVLGAYVLAASLDESDGKPKESGYSEVISMEEAHKYQGAYQQWRSAVQDMCGPNSHWILISLQQAQCYTKKGVKTKIIDLPLITIHR